jgi:hypothetical protein
MGFARGSERGSQKPKGPRAKVDRHRKSSTHYTVSNQINQQRSRQEGLSFVRQSAQSVDRASGSITDSDWDEGSGVREATMRAEMPLQPAGLAAKLTGPGPAARGGSRQSSHPNLVYVHPIIQSVAYGALHQPPLYCTTRVPTYT